MPELITVHEKALAHLSRGLYRSPASALRELVSNAWDAGASEVRISTSHPTFVRLVVEDNGDGFTRKEFVRLMSGGIGNSEKRTPEKQQAATAKRTKGSEPSRPVIGRLGIGMLGIAQICGRFTVQSKTKSGEGFRAEVRLFDLLREHVDGQPDPAEEDIVVQLGEYEFDEEFEPSLVRKGTIISSSDVYPQFSKSFNDTLPEGANRVPSLKWPDIVRVISTHRTLQELGDYYRLLFELAVSAPIPYISQRSLPEAVISADQKVLEKFGFAVVVDNVELRKPVQLSGNKDGYTTKRIAETTLQVYNRPLRFHGYLLVQEGLQLKPDELRGILIRIKNVAVGYYDQTMLDYRINHGPRNRWLTGEIYVDEGLEDALNIDRDSFNRFHPQYKALQKHIHEILDREIFPEVYRQIDKRSKAKAKVKAETRDETVRDVISNALGSPVKIKRASFSAKSDEYPEIDEGKQGIDVVLPREETVVTRKPNRSLAIAVLALFEIAMRRRTAAERREAFKTSLFDLLSKW